LVEICIFPLKNLKSTPLTALYGCCTEPSGIGLNRLKLDGTGRNLLKPDEIGEKRFQVIGLIVFAQMAGPTGWF
jgi:hypothetical protein